ncbi:MAG: tetratricopeptide repeat protein, partial [Prevotella sp.]|nr:tetratricopeptide repeat protein [Prevotella sp.]
MDEEERDITDLVNRYEQMLETGTAVYFDTEEFDDLAAYYDMLDEVDKAKEIIETGLKIHPGNQMLLLARAKFMTDDAGYQKTLDYLNETFDGYDVELYLLKIECLLQLEQPEQAATLAEELLNDDELDEEIILAELGFTYADADYFEDAIALLEQSLACNPENIDVLTELSYAYEMCDDFDKAIAVSNKALDIDPYACDVWINLGKYYTMQDNYEKAIDAFDFALAVSADGYEVMKLKAHCLSLCGKIDEAIALFEECIASNRADDLLYYTMADCYFSMERYDDMLKCLDKYEELHGKSPEIFAKKALGWLQKNNLEKACASLMSGMEIDPESEDLSIVTGEFYFRLGEYSNAEFFFLHAYERDSSDVIMID